MAKIDLDKHIWEGWRVRDFIDDLKPQIDIIITNSRMFGVKPFDDKKELKEWLKDNQPYYKKHIPDVYHYFVQYCEM